RFLCRWGFTPERDLADRPGEGDAGFQQPRSRAGELAPVAAEARVILRSAGSLAWPPLALEMIRALCPPQRITHGGCPSPLDAGHLANQAAAGAVRPGRLGRVR